MDDELQRRQQERREQLRLLELQEFLEWLQSRDSGAAKPTSDSDAAKTTSDSGAAGTPEWLEHLQRECENESPECQAAAERFYRANIMGDTLEFVSSAVNYGYHLARAEVPLEEVERLVRGRLEGQRKGAETNRRRREKRQDAIVPLFREWWTVHPNLSKTEAARQFAILTSDPTKSDMLGEQIQRFVEEHGPCSQHTPLAISRRREDWCQSLKDCYHSLPHPQEHDLTDFAQLW